jgi:endonuclease YncB( thermonuclease family)
MVKWFALVVALIISSAQAHDFVSEPVRVIDGDTVELRVNWLPPELGTKLSLRVYGIDTPEKSFRAKCEREKAAGEAASLFTKDALQSATTKQIIIKEWDKFGGRVLGDMMLDGKSLREMLISNGFARPYFGDKKKSWCE